MKTFSEYKRVLAGIGFTLMITVLAACDRGADPEMDAGNTETSPAYNTGYEFGLRLAILQQQQPGTGPDEALQGMCDALSDTNQPSHSEMCAELQPGESAPVESVETGQTKTSIEGFNNETSELDTSDENAVVTLTSGVQYEVLKTGSGAQPRAGDEVVISYQTYLDDGSLFGSTGNDGGSRQLALDDIKVPGLKEALLLMNEGSRWKVTVPPNMGFTQSGNRTLRRSNLTYDIELISVEQG